VKIDVDIKRKAIPEHIRQHLTADYGGGFKENAFGLTVLMIGFFTLLPLFAAQDKTLFYVVGLFVAFLLLWLVKISFTSEQKLFREPTLFLGVTGVIGSLAHLITFLHFTYYAVVESTLYYVFLFIASVIFVLAWYFICRQYVKKYSSWKEIDFTKKWWYSAILHTLFVLVIVTLILDVLGELWIGIKVSLFMIFYSYFSAFYIFVGSKYLHKYWFMTKNIELVKRLNGGKRMQPKNNRTKNG